MESQIQTDIKVGIIPNGISELSSSNTLWEMTKHEPVWFPIICCK